MIVISAVLNAKRGKEVELEQLLKTLFNHVKQENGVVEYVLHRGQKDPGKFFFYEKYKDQQAVDFHMSTAYLKETFEKYEELLSKPSEVEFYENIATITKD